MNERRRGVLSRLALFGAAIVWGSSFFVIKGAVDYLPPATLQAVRFSVGALVLGAIFWKKVKRLTGSDWLRGLLVGAFLGAASLVQNVGIQDTTPGKNAFLTCVYCIIVPFMFWGVRGERPQAKRFVAAVLSGVVFFAEYAGDQNPWVYSIGYNGAYMLPECIICVVLALAVGLRLTQQLSKAK